VLTSWSDDGTLREAIRIGKASRRFDDTVVTAAVSMIDSLWQPNPAPTWVTCVPSLRRPELVRDLAKRLADQLHLPLVECIEKRRETEPQKRQENSVHQCRNLDGAFGTTGNMPPGPVILVDDMVDSGWTLTILAMVLRKAGSGPVFPFALASTAGGDDR
ncbi:MAG: hypothetical protein WKF81_10000, partial [Thermomicrobiales bacterium]